jgi:hypothetical protein
MGAPVAKEDVPAAWRQPVKDTARVSPCRSGANHPRTERKTAETLFFKRFQHLLVRTTLGGASPGGDTAATPRRQDAPWRRRRLKIAPPPARIAKGGMPVGSDILRV